LGDEIEAQFGFANGIHGTFTSCARLRQTSGPWGLILVGEKGIVRVLTDIAPRIFSLKAGGWEADGSIDRWEPLLDDPMRNAPAPAGGFGGANRRVVDDWLQAITEQREPACSGAAGLKALEMAMGVFEAGLSKERVTFPLRIRT